MDKGIVTKVRILASGSGCYPHGCVHHPADEARPPIHQSSMKFDHSSTSQGYAKTSSDVYFGKTLLAQRNAVSIHSTTGAERLM
ncbi:hypothetical protein [Parasitella parasitica]|uniref:Uncharacterized protein n=1 Tax=Parasitella parasitica TaxID=35722 RepID=A0A0B7NSV0_9FUNG|nr:hypothetical protein [Parasitella parasitica]